MINRWWIAGGVAGLVVIAVLAVQLARVSANLRIADSNYKVLQSDNTRQAETIASQSLAFHRANMAAEAANRLNMATGANSETEVIKYREILRREKTCDYPVPADIAGGLLEYTARLRSRALRANTGDADGAGVSAVPARSLTYCQAVLWINPLLSAIEKANNQLAAIEGLSERR